MIQFEALRTGLREWKLEFDKVKVELDLTKTRVNWTIPNMSWIDPHEPSAEATAALKEIRKVKGLENIEEFGATNNEMHYNSAFEKGIDEVTEVDKKEGQPKIFVGVMNADQRNPVVFMGFRVGTLPKELRKIR
jgi:hypothetical protein